MLGKSVFLFSLLTLSFSSLAADYINLPVSTFELKAKNVYDQINDLTRNPSPALHRYKPVGMQIKDKVINKNQIQFWATKELLGMTRTVFYKGLLDLSHIPSRNNQKCFQAILDFTGSGDLIIDNIERLEMTFCTKEKATDHLIVTMNSRLLKGARYGGIMGAIAKSIIIDQVPPVVTAIKEEIQKN